MKVDGRIRKRKWVKVCGVLRYLSSALIVQKNVLFRPGHQDKGGCERTFVWTLGLDRVADHLLTQANHTIMNSPMKGRLGNDTMKALGVDDVTAAEKWLYDDQTHIEDTEVIFLATHSD